MADAGIVVPALDVASTATTVPPDEARDAAADILAGDKYQPNDLPRPLKGFFETLARWLEPVTNPIGRAFADIFSNPLFALAFVLGVLALVVFGCSFLVRRRGRAVRAGSFGRGFVERTGKLDPDALEREADQAEGASDFERAVRLRFLAGLVRLDAAGVFRYRPSVTRGQLEMILRSPTFDDLAASFDEIVYGGRPATGDDVARSKAGWPKVLTGAGKR